MTVISASRRTDIPAFYSRWLEHRLRAGFCLVPNPFNPGQVARVSLRPEEVDAIVFWTRDPDPAGPLLDLLDGLGIPTLFLVTITAYGPPLERATPAPERAVEAFRRLADRLGPERVVWRYDPIILGPGLEPDHHRRRFEWLSARLRGSTTTVKTSFVDLYRKTRRRLAALPGGELLLRDPAAEPQAGALLADLAALARGAGMGLETCAEEADWSDAGAPRGRCIDPVRLNRLFGLRLPLVEDRGQRPACGCAPARDIGMTDSCLHGCAYCYATRSHDAALTRHNRHEPTAPTLIP